MADRLKVAWQNGMSIDKVHFEQQERYIERNINQKTIFIHNNLYGVLHLAIAYEMLSQGKIALQRVEGIAKDGSIFNAPEQDSLPIPLDIKESKVSNPVITLKIQTNVDSTPEISMQNSIPNSKFISTQALIASTSYDEALNPAIKQNYSNNISHTQNKINVMLASIRISLGFLGDKLPNELEFPICKIKSIDSSNKITLDETFIPTSLDISKLPPIIAFIDEMIYSTAQHKNSLNEIFKGIDKTKNTLDFTTYLSLNLFKKWNLQFLNIKSKDKIHPEFFYDKLLEFQIDLMSICEYDKVSEFLQYNHENLTETILPLIEHTRVMFAKVVSPRYIVAKVMNNGNGFYDCMFDNAGIVKNSDIFFAVRADVSLDFLQNNFKSQSKIHTQSKIKNIVASQLKGLNIIQIQMLPSNLPHLNGYVYYKIDENDKQILNNESIISFYITTNIKNPDIKVWAILH